MNESGKDLDLTIQLVKKQDQRGTLQLYKWLYASSDRIFERTGFQTQKQDLFQDAFLTLEKQIQLGRFQLLEGSPPERKMAQLKNYFERLLEKLIYNCSSAVSRVLDGVRQEQTTAINQLVKHLHHPGFIGYSEKLAGQFQVRTIEAGDFHTKAISILLDKIKSQEFELSADLPNEIQLKQLAKFFNQIMYRQINNWKRDTQREAKRAEKYVEEMEEQEISEEVPELEMRSVLGSKVVALFENLDTVGRYILRAHYLEGLNAKQIAKKSPFEGFQKTEAIHQKRFSSLKKLSTDLFSIRGRFSMEELRQLTEMTQYFITQVAEPCRSILLYAFPPANKKPEEIALILQQTRPREEVSNLITGSQVKKRKYKCKLNLWDQLWKELLNPEGSPH